MNEDIRLFLETELKKPSSAAIEDCYEDFDKGHGRIESRKCFVSSQVDWLDQKEQWAGLKTIAMIEEPREMKGKEPSIEWVVCEHFEGIFRDKIAKIWGFPSGDE